MNTKLFLVVMMALAFGIMAKAQNEMTISWLPIDETQASHYGVGDTLTAYMEFDLNDIRSYKLTTRSIDTIKRIQFYLDSAYFSLVTRCDVVIRQGNTFATGTDSRQSVPITNLVGKWNDVTLNTPYVVDTNKKLFIGYRLSFTGGYPFAMARGNEPKQGGWFLDASGVPGNISSNGYVFLIKAVATSVTPIPVDKIALLSLDIQRDNILGDSLLIKGKVENLGSAPITSFNLVYTLNGKEYAVDTIKGLNIASYSMFDFTSSQKYVLDSLSCSNITVRVFNPNGVADPTMSNTLEKEVRVYSNRIQRVSLYEVFTSSTCNPCNTGNVQLKSVLDQVDNTKWACIKYQYTGDPYYTLEGGSKVTFYGGVSNPPVLVADGTNKMELSSYTVSLFNALSAVPALATTKASAIIDNKKVDFKVTIKPVTNMTNANLRFVAAIVEKKTERNVKTNGETEFYYVMKKFMTAVNGDVIAPLRANDSIALNDYSYTFNGNYRLPNDSDRIDHNTEHSIEDFKNLMVVYWLQDDLTKEVFQAGKVDVLPVMYNVTVLANDPSRGVVIGSGNYSKDTVITISATSNAGYRFLYWNDKDTHNIRSITVTEDIVFTAVFGIDAPGKYYLSVFANNPNMGTTTGSGDYDANEITTITATANQGYYFSQWDDGNTQNPRSITVTQDISYTAVFVPMHTVTVSANNSTWGTVTGEGIYPNGSIDTLSATPSIGYYFLQWQDSNTNNPRIITVTQDTDFVAEFVKLCHVSVAANHTNLGTVTGEGDYQAMTTITITADPYSGSRFVCWHDADCQNPRTITVTQDTIFVATFAIISAIEDIDLSAINIYPNPAIHGQFTVKHDQWTTGDRVEIYTVQGLCIHNCELTESLTQINISHLSSGLYFVKLKTSQGETIKKLTLH